MSNPKVCRLMERQRHVQAHIDSLLALPYSTREDAWWQEAFARFQQSKDAIRKALILERRPEMKLMSKNPWLWNRRHFKKAQVNVGGVSFPKRIDHP